MQHGITVLHLYDGEYFKDMHEYDHYTLVIEGIVTPSDSAIVAAELRTSYRVNRKTNIVCLARRTLKSLGYSSVKMCKVEEIDYTGFEQMLVEQ